MNKIPCILCNSELWEYISPNLIKWEYKYYIDPDPKWDLFPILIINWCGHIGNLNNDNYASIKNHNRKLLTNVEEFLEKAAELKGFIYKRKDTMEINGIEIKPGMVIETQSKNTWIVFPTEKGLAVTSYQANQWDNINSFIEDFKNNIETIYDLSDSNFLTGGVKLWEKPKETALTMDQIAEKFGIPVEKLKIKK